MIDLDSRYLKLWDALEVIYRQVAEEKGEKRHGDGMPFEHQGMCRRGRTHGIGFLTGQIAKKAEEIQRIIEQHGEEAGVREAAGIGGYAAGLIILLKERQPAIEGGGP